MQCKSYRPSEKLFSDGLLSLQNSNYLQKPVPSFPRRRESRCSAYKCLFNQYFNVYLWIPAYAGMTVLSISDGLKIFLQRYRLIIFAKFLSTSSNLCVMPGLDPGIFVVSTEIADTRVKPGYDVNWGVSDGLSGFCPGRLKHHTAVNKHRSGNVSLRANRSDNLRHRRG